MVCIDWPIMRRSFIHYIHFFFIASVGGAVRCQMSHSVVQEAVLLWNWLAARQTDGSDVVGVADGAAKLHQGNVALCAHFLLTTI